MSTETVEIIIRDAGGAETALSIRGVGTAASESAVEVEGLNSTLEMMATTLAGLGIGFEIAQFIEMADATQLLTDRMSQFSQSSADLEGTWKNLLAISDEAHQSLESTADLYLKLTVAGQSLHVSQDNLLIITRVMSDELAASGKSADEAGRALIGLTRALQTGTLSAQTLSSMLRTMPGLGNLIAQSLYGVNGTVIQLQEGIKAGNVSVTDFFNAIIKGAPQAEADAAKMTVTVVKAFTDLKNHLEDYIRSADSAGGFTGHLADIIETLATHIQPVVGVLSLISFGLLAYGVAAGIAAFASLSLGASFSGIAMLVTMAAVAFETLEGPLGLITGLLIGMAGIAIANWFNTLTIAVRATTAAVATFASGLVLAVAGGIAVFVAAMDVAIMACVLFKGQGIQAALDAAKTFNAELQSMASSGVMAAANSIRGMLPSLTEAQTAWKGSSAALNGLTSELIANGPALAAHNAAATNAATSATTAANAHGQHAAAVKNLGVEIKTTTNSIDSHGQAIQKTTDSFRQYDGTLTAVSSTLKTVSGDTTTLVTSTRDVDGALQATSQTITKVSDGIKTSTAYVRDYDGAWVETSQTIDQQVIPALNSTASAIQSVSGAAASGASALAGLNSAMASMNGGGGGGMFSNIPTDATAQQARADWYNHNVNLGSGSPGAFRASGGEWTIPHHAAGAEFSIPHYAGGLPESLVGGTGAQDSQLVQFMASPDETVSVKTPSQRDAASRGISVSMPININVNTPDAQSFRRNQMQILAPLADAVQRINSKLGRVG